MRAKLVAAPQGVFIDTGPVYKPKGWIEVLFNVAVGKLSEKALLGEEPEAGPPGLVISVDTFAVRSLIPAVGLKSLALDQRGAAIGGIGTDQRVVII